MRLDAIWLSRLALAATKTKESSCLSRLVLALGHANESICFWARIKVMSIENAAVQNKLNECYFTLREQNDN